MLVFGLFLASANILVSAEENAENALNVGMCRELLRDCKNNDPHYCSPKNKQKVKRYLCNPGCRSAFTEEADLDFFDELCSSGLRSAHALCPQGGCNGAFDLFHINGYGCWCNFGDDLLKGYGKPQDVYDFACRDYQQCLRCTDVDSNGSCDPKTADYEWSISGLWSGCGATSACESQLCECQTSFLKDLFIISFVQNQDINLPTNHVMGFNKDTCAGNDRLTFFANAEPVAYDYIDQADLFDTATITEEHSVVVSERLEKKCCGLYPKRAPFVPGSKRCCKQENLFNPITETCCENGETAPLGNC